MSDDDQTVEETTPTPPQPGVFVYARRSEQGISIDYQVVGDVDPLTIPTLLEASVGVARKNLGLPPLK